MEDKLAMEVIELLTSPVAKLKIVSIVGMPGIGKTKLADSVYNHASMNLLFGVRAWCFASQTYKKEELLSEILSQIGGNSSKSQPDSHRDLAQEVYRSLKGRKYLIVIDDVWDAEFWNSLKQIIPDDRQGSRILLTTRHRAVALRANSISYPLRLLSNEESYQLLVSKVFDVGEPCSQQMLAILKRVARTCNGLPLAIVLIAGILKTTEKKQDSWKLVSEPVMDLYHKHGKSLGMVHLTRVLTLSYNHLPDFLKPCFLYFGAVPKVSTIPVSMLIRLWISEGFVGLEERGREYLNELVDRSLVIVDRTSSQNGAKTCRIHDVLRDFCSRTLEKRNFLSQEDKFGGILFLRGNRVREIHSCLYQYRSHRAPVSHQSGTKASKSNRKELTLGTVLLPVTRKGRSSHSGSSPYNVPSPLTILPHELPPVIRKSSSSRSVSSKSPLRVPSSLNVLPHELPPVTRKLKSSHSVSSKSPHSVPSSLTVLPHEVPPVIGKSSSSRSVSSKSSLSVPSSLRVLPHELPPIIGKSGSSRSVSSKSPLSVPSSLIVLPHELPPVIGKSSSSRSVSSKSPLCVPSSVIVLPHQLPPVIGKSSSSRSVSSKSSLSVPSSLIALPHELPPVTIKLKSSRSMSSKSPHSVPSSLIVLPEAELPSHAVAVQPELLPLEPVEVPSLISPPELPLKPAEESSLISPSKLPLKPVGLTKAWKFMSRVLSQPLAPRGESSHSYHTSTEFPTGGSRDRTYSTGHIPQGSFRARPRGTASTRTPALHTVQVKQLKYSSLLKYKKLGVLDLGNVRFESGADPSDFVMIATTLVDLTYLAIRLRGNEIPVEISNLQKLQTLVLKGVIGTIFVPESFGKLLSLRHLITDHGLFTFEHCSQLFFDNFSQMDNMKSISNLVLRPGSNVEKYMLKMLPGLQKLGCRFVADFWDSSVGYSVFPNMDFLNELKSLKIFFSREVLSPCKFSFPLNLTKLCMSNSRLPWDQMSLIAQLLPNLEVLKLLSKAFQGGKWETGAGEDQFAKLKLLKMESLDIEKWDVDNAHHFPSLEQLVVLHCEQLHELPDAIGEISTLKLIEMKWCRPSASASATRILELQRDYSNLDLNLTLHHNCVI